MRRSVCNPNAEDRAFAYRSGLWVPRSLSWQSGGVTSRRSSRATPAAVKSEDGKYLDKDGNPTYKVIADGTVDWYTYSGYRRYHSECHVCHGP